VPFGRADNVTDGLRSKKLVGIMIMLMCSEMGQLDARISGGEIANPWMFKRL
jgi:hypothetical protein